MIKTLSGLLFMYFTALACAGELRAQEAGTAGQFAGIEELMSELNRIAQGGDDSRRTAAIDGLWQRLEDGGDIPFTERERVLFLYRGDAGRVNWRGDFNRWGRDDEDAGAGTRIAGTDVWVYELELPCDARVDYKIVEDGSEWILDPANGAQQWGGAGPNSELPMPCYEMPEETVERPGVERGVVSPFTFTSQELGYDISFYVYFPHDYQEINAYPVIYVTDGHEYADENMGRMVTVLDNAIADSLIPPVMAVFIDPRDPYSGENRRETEYLMNPRFAAFLARELVPGIDDAFPTSMYDGDRALMGTSLGGINTAYVVLNYPQVFGRAVIHSPAFWLAPELLDAYRESIRQPVSMYVSAGTIHDGLEQAAEFREILFDNAWHMNFVEVNQGHSWGHWKGQILPALLFFWEETH